MTIALHLQNASKFFGHGADIVRAVDDVTFDIRDNEFFTLLGPSGCGKTTVLRLIAGLENPDSGTVELFGEDITARPANQRPVNTVFQNYALFPHMTVAQNIGFGLKMQDTSKDEIDKTVDEMLDLVQMAEQRSRKPGQLSGGQQQRVALARALANHPKMLLLDESLSALDFKLRKEMQLELKRLQKDTGITFVFVTHDQEEALAMSDRIAVMNKGKIEQIGTPQEIYDEPANLFIADFIGTCNFLNAVELGLKDDGKAAFRPEHAKIADSGQLSGKIIDMTYRGTVVLYIIQTHSGENVVVRTTPDVEFGVGQDVHVSVDEAQIKIFKDGEQ